MYGIVENDVKNVLSLKLTEIDEDWKVMSILSALDTMARKNINIFYIIQRLKCLPRTQVIQAQLQNAKTHLKIEQRELFYYKTHKSSIKK